MMPKGREQWGVGLSNSSARPPQRSSIIEKRIRLRETLSNDCHLALRYVKEGEMRVLRQKQLIAGLETKQQPTLEAEESLGLLEIRLKRLRTHLEIMRAFMQPGSRGKSIYGGLSEPVSTPHIIERTIR
jgi:hypothetical protein